MPGAADLQKQLLAEVLFSTPQSLSIKLPPWRMVVEEAGYETAVTLDFGVNNAASDPFALKRIGARHPKRTSRNFLALAAAGFPMRFFFGPH